MHTDTCRHEAAASPRPSHELTITFSMTLGIANFSGNVHGGTLLELLDRVPYACVSRHAGAYVTDDQRRRSRRALLRRRLRDEFQASLITTGMEG